MTKKALIKITGTQSLDGDSDKIELTTIGTFEETSEHYIFRYKEHADEKNKINTRLSISKNGEKVELTRSGAYGSILIIERSKRNLCNYATEFGDLLMGIYGRSIENNPGEKDGSFSFGYDIDVNGALTSENTVLVEYKIH
ncbi:MAG: DUF1934 domain-containing protein [Eubacterium sp.]|nr:DUF1934 domain-containing protein [Eubacterium sp.]